MLQKTILTLDDAKRVAAAAEAEAKRNGWAVVIAVADSGGHLLYLQRTHDAQFGSIEVAMKKARASAAFRRPSKAWEEAIAEGRLGHGLAIPGAIAVEGGLPLVVDGEVVGAIGVSGVRPFQDGQIAKAGADALTAGQ